MYETIAILLYFAVVLAIGISVYSKNKSDFIIGNRSLGPWQTALSAQASDMSNWLFMAYPALVFSTGLSGSWVAIGVFLFMLLNWQYIAPKIRRMTEQTGSLTFSSFFEKRFSDHSGRMRLTTVAICFIFYTIYISSGLVGMGRNMESLLGIPYQWGLLIGLVIVIPYIFFGGYLTLARIDLFQGLFLMGVIVAVPLYLIFSKGITITSTPLIPHNSSQGVIQALIMVLGWGLGYFGQPAIVTKFMGIKNPDEIPRSKLIGLSWMLISLAAATLVGLVGTALFAKGTIEPELVFIEMVKTSFHPFLVGLILCAVFAAAINVMCSQILVVASTFAEDLAKGGSPEKQLWVSRLSILFVGALAFLIAFFKISSIYNLVLFAWSGLGSAFGPLMLFSLYSKKVNRYGAWAGILSGAFTAGVWGFIDKHLSLHIDPMVPGFFISAFSIWAVSTLTQKKDERAYQSTS